MFNPNHVSVTVVSAKNLRVKGKNGKNDVFVVIQLGQSKFQTAIQQKSVVPRWEEECEFFYDGPSNDLILTVYHRNLFGFDEFLGQVRLPLDEVCEPPTSLRPSNRWFPLRGKSSKKDKEQKYRGELEIRLLFSRKQRPEAPAEEKQKENILVRLHSVEPDTKSLKKPSFMGSMPSLVGGNVLRPPSPTGSVKSVGKKKSFLSKLKNSASFHVQKKHYVDESVGSYAIREEEFIKPRLSAGFLEPVAERRKSGDAEQEEQFFEEDEHTNAVTRRGGVVSLGGPANLYHIQKVEQNQRLERANPRSRPVSLNFGDNQAPTNATVENHNYLRTISQPSSDQNGQVSVPKSSSSTSIRNMAVESTTNSAQLKDVTPTLASSKEDLLRVIKDQRIVINHQQRKIRELEEYIDQMLVRIMTTQPQLLQSPLDSSSQNSASTANCANSNFTKRNGVFFSSR